MHIQINWNELLVVTRLTCILTQMMYISLKLVWPVPLAQVGTRPQLIFPSKTWFFGIYLNFQRQKSLKISPTFWIQILPNKFH
jgi:hypothetical protein